jgi:hypothetical protein
MHVHEDDVSAVLAQLERHILGDRFQDTTRGLNEIGGSYRWQADGACDEDAA